MERLWNSLVTRARRHQRDVPALLLGLCALAAMAFTSGCGPGLVALSGGSAGTFFGLQGSGDDDKDGSEGSSSGPTNVLPAVIVTGLTRQESPSIFSYTILDANNDVCSIEVEYAVNGGSFAPCFEGPGGDGATGLSSSAGGSSHTFAWDYFEDVGPQLTQDITVRIRANDGADFGNWFSLTGQRVGNDAPSLGPISVVGTDTVLFTFDFFDQSNDPGSIELSYSTDQGQNFTPVNPFEIVGNPPTSLQTSPVGFPNQFIWDSSVALNDYVGEVFVKLDPWDQPSGFTMPTPGAPVISGPYSIDNDINTPPDLVLQSSYDAATFVGRVGIDFTISDDEQDSARVDVEYSLDGGLNFFDATLINQFAQGVAGPFPTGTSPTFYSTTWDALTDISQIVPYANSYSNVVFRITARDAVAGTPLVTDAFTLIGNEAPQVLSVSTLQDSGNIPIVIDVIDSTGDETSVLIEFSTDAQNYTTLNPGDFAFGDPGSLNSSKVGEENVLVWDSTIHFPNLNAASVTLRLTPTDHPDGGTPTADLTGQVYVNASFAVVNNPAGADPVSIDVFTTDSAGTPTNNPQVTVSNGGTVYLDSEINPSSSTVTATYWRILETGADYGTLLTTAGNPLTFSTGSITCAAPGSIVDGDTFAIDDGLNGPQTLEFDTNGLAMAGNSLVDIAASTTVDDVALAVAATINASSSILITATTTGGGGIDLQHEIACLIGNEVGFGGNAASMSATGTSVTVVAQLSGGVGVGAIRYDAPATPPAGTDWVTLVCEVDHPSYYTTVTTQYRLYWGDAPTGVAVSPTTTDVLVNGAITFSATVAPSGAPQLVTWSVMGGTANGTISSAGVYTAPPTAPSTNPVTIKAVSVNPAATQGMATVTIRPEPTGITVNPPSANPPTWFPPDLQLGVGLSFSATVAPAAAPSEVNWRIFWNNQDWGSGNNTVGMVDSSGNYTPPPTLPSPDQVQIQAVSKAKPSVFGGYMVRLIAPPPTSFTVTPMNSFVHAGGAGQKFSAINFVPSNANTAVTWEINPQVGSIDASGNYTPPASLSTAQTIVVTGRSVADTMITGSTNLEVRPNLPTPPSSIVIFPGESVTTSNGPSVQFSATVFPGSAPQAVSWSFAGSSFGTIDQTGKYMPGQNNVDVTVTLRCESAADSQVFATVNVCVTGDGQNWAETENTIIGRGGQTTVWDEHNDRLWMLGGKDELTDSGDHTLAVTFIDYSGATPTLGSYAPVGSGGVSSTNTIAAAYDSDNDRILAFVGRGASTAEVWELDVTGVPAASWNQLFPLSLPLLNSPVTLSENHHYHCWFDDNVNEVQILRDNGRLYTFDTNSDLWNLRTSIGNTSLAPQSIELTGHTMDDSGSDYVHYFVGASDSGNGATNEVYWFDTKQYRWSKLFSSGSVPGAGLVSPSVYLQSGIFQVFGGRPAGQTGHSDALYSFDRVGSNAVWSLETLGANSHAPSARGDGFFGLAGTNGAYLIGGLSANGVCGDYWQFDEVQVEFKPFNPDGIVPQGRHGAAGAMKNGRGYLFGGATDHGVSDELWMMQFNDAQSRPTWTKLDTSGIRPPALRDASMVYDSVNDVMLLFGGSGEVGDATGLENDVYAFNTSTLTWTLLNPGGPKPVARLGHACCYDPENQRMWVFGGQSAVALLANLYYLDLSSGIASATWANVTGASGSAPDPRKFATMGYDQRKDRVLVLGGDSTPSGPNRQLFEYKLSLHQWTPLSIGGTSADRNVHRSGAVYDDSCSRFLNTPANVKSAQGVVMTSATPNWQYLNPPTFSNNTLGGTGLYDAAKHRYYVLFGSRQIGARAVGTNVLKKVDFD